jgi:beta-D-galactosyl-(1->4)-L-rhamnose phosphorylase
LLRQKIERCGLGGYLHLTNDYPDFLDAMDSVLAEFRQIGALHDDGAPFTLQPKIAILHAWGALRSWTLSGHFHETDRHLLIHVLESLSGLPFDVKFISFEDVKDGCLANVDVVISAGDAGDAWSGGACWKDNAVVELLTEWVHNGGLFFGIGEPSAVEGFNSFLRMAHVLGVDIDKGERACHGRWAFDVSRVEGLIPQGAEIQAREGLFLTDGTARVLDAVNNIPSITLKEFGKGKGVYCAGFSVKAPMTKLLQNLIIYAKMGKLEAEGLTDDPYTECAVFPDAGKIVLINNSDVTRDTACVWKGKQYRAELEGKKMKILDLE